MYPRHTLCKLSTPTAQAIGVGEATSAPGNIFHLPTGLAC